MNFPPPEGKKPVLCTHYRQLPSQPSSIGTVDIPAEICGLQLTETRLNGDYNPLHATPEPGQKMGFGGAIMHGLFSWDSACHGLLQALGGSDPANIREFQARFAAPVKPGISL